MNTIISTTVVCQSAYIGDWASVFSITHNGGLLLETGLYLETWVYIRVNLVYKFAMMLNTPIMISSSVDLSHTCLLLRI